MTVPNSKGAFMLVFLLYVLLLRIVGAMDHARYHHINHDSCRKVAHAHCKPITQPSSALRAL